MRQPSERGLGAAYSLVPEIVQSGLFRWFRESGVYHPWLPVEGEQMKRVLVVDDSAFARRLIQDVLKASGQFVVVGTAVNGLDALGKLESLQPDVITLDVEMPGMNGLETLSRIMELRPTPVVMLSSMTTRGADTSIAALNLGAVDVIAKPMSHGLPQLQGIADELVSILSSAATADVRKIMRRSESLTSMEERRTLPPRVSCTPHTVVIASSTGGPKALRYLVPRLPVEYGTSYVIVQHLPAGFTKVLARDLDSVCRLPVHEAKSDDALVPNTVLIAPAGKHCIISLGGRIVLSDDPPLWGVRPAADITFTSAATVLRSRVIGVVLTGMGRDGASGLGMIKAKGGRTLAEHESTCVIYGMPKAAIESGAAEQAVPLDSMHSAIESAVKTVIGQRAAA